MDYTKISRELIYRDKRDIEDYPIGIPNTIEQEFFNLLIERPFIKESNKAAANVLHIFNNAYYICALVFMEKLKRSSCGLTAI